MAMLLTRLGNKKGMSKELYNLFPPHKLRITLFFGAGGVFFYTPRSKFNVINDLDDDVTNLFFVVRDRPDELIEVIKDMPISISLLKRWQVQIPKCEILRAARFVLMSNFTYLGKGDTIRFGVGNEKENTIKKIKEAHLELGDARIMNADFRDVINCISFSPTVCKREEAFVYMDPVYLDTSHYYRVPNWTKDDTFDCFEIMSNEGIPAAMSEFDHPFVLSEAYRRGFVVTPIKMRRNIKNHRREILITNYKPPQLLF